MKVLDEFEAEDDVLKDYPILSSLVHSHPNVYFRERFGIYNRVKAREEQAFKSQDSAELIPRDGLATPLPTQRYVKKSNHQED